jgi:hypothetical protein
MFLYFLNALLNSSGTQSRECELCGDYDHTTKFCEKQRSKEIPLQKAPQSMANIRSVVVRGESPVGSFLHARCFILILFAKISFLTCLKSMTFALALETGVTKFTKNGFDTMVSKTNLPTVECKNLQSAFRNPDIVDNLIKQEVEKGYLKGAFEKPPI